MAPIGSAPPGAADVSAHVELDLEKRLARFLRGRGRANGSGQERLAPALLLRRPGLLGLGRQLDAIR